MVSISSSVQAGEASQEKPMQEIAPESMSATEERDVNRNIDCATYARVAVGCGEVGMELWVVPMSHPRHDHLEQAKEKKVFTEFQNLFNVLHNILPVLRFLRCCGRLKVCEVTGGDLKRKSI